MISRRIRVHDPLQPQYTYVCTAPIGKNFDPEFTPELTPQQMLELGIFDGVYFPEGKNEFPKEWFVDAKVASENAPDSSLNFFHIHASQSREVWIAKGWIHADDPRGWFQWYCRYYLGRRHADDVRQIKRWKAIRRHINQVRNNCMQGDWGCRSRQRQALLHWAYDSRKL